MHATMKPDRDKHGRYEPGTPPSVNTTGHRNANSRITETEAALIKRGLLEGESPTHLGRLFGLAYEGVRQIAKHRTWRHVGPASANPLEGIA